MKASKIILGMGLILMAGTLSLWSAVYTTRDNPARLDTPGSFGARKIYGGQFRINGQPAQMDVLSCSESVPSTLRILKAGNPGDLVSREVGGMVVGASGKGTLRKRFLLFSVDKPSPSLMFVLEAGPELDVAARAPAPWPSAFPSLDPLQQPRLTVEHLDADFLFACAAIPQTTRQRATESCRSRMLDDGWKAEPETGHSRKSEGMAELLVFSKNNRVCWMDVQDGPSPNQVMVTLLCKKP